MLVLWSLGCPNFVMNAAPVAPKTGASGWEVVVGVVCGAEVAVEVPTTCASDVLVAFMDVLVVCAIEGVEVLPPPGGPTKSMLAGH
jgi:hypothetical protein